MQKKILLDLGNETKRKMSSQIIDKINKNSFKKFDFDKLSKDESVKIQKINLQSRRDDKILKKEIVNQIYAYPEKKIIVVWVDNKLSSNQVEKLGAKFFDFLKNNMIKEDLMDELLNNIIK